MEIVKFIFSSFWTFAGVFLLSLVAVSVIKAFFDFIVELVHGKQPVVNIPESAKFVSKGDEKTAKALMKKAADEKPANDGKEHVDASVTMKVGDIQVRSNKKK